MLAVAAAPARRRPAAGWPPTRSPRNPARTAATAVALTIGLSVVRRQQRLRRRASSGTIRDQIDRNFARDFTVQADRRRARDRRVVPDRPARCSARIARAARGRRRHAGPRALVKLPGTHAARRPTGSRSASTRRRTARSTARRSRGAPRAPRRSRGARAAAACSSRRPTRETAACTSATRSRCTAPARHAARRVVGELRRADRRSAASTMQMSPTHDDARLRRRPTTRSCRSRRARRADARRARREIDAHARPRATRTSRRCRRPSSSKQIDDQINQQFALFNAILAIAVIVRLLGVVNTLAMSVIERTREIGVLRALGSSRWLVRAQPARREPADHHGRRARRDRRRPGDRVAWIAGLGDVLPGITFQLPAGATLHRRRRGASSSERSPRSCPRAARRAST